MRTAFGLSSYPWDFTGNPETLLDRALGEVGFDALIVSAVTGPQERFRIEPEQPPHTFATEGGWHFPTQPESFQGCAVKPRAARWCGKRDVLEKIQKYAAQRGVQLILEVNPRAVSGLLDHEPHLRSRDAWGDVNSALGACVMNADLRELLRATLTDLGRYSPAGWQLVNWMTDLLPVDGTPSALAWHALLPRLLNICFCPACRQVAAVEGVDPDAAAETVRRLTLELMHAPARELSVFPTENLRNYLEIRRRDVVRWLGRLRESFPDQAFYMTTAPWSRMDSWTQAHAVFETLGEGYTLIFNGSTRNAAAAGGADAESQRSFPPPEISSYGRILPVWYPEVRQADELVKTVATAAAADAVLLEFEGLDAAPREALDWLRQAVRFARRSVE